MTIHHTARTPASWLTRWSAMILAAILLVGLPGCGEEANDAGEPATSGVEADTSGIEGALAAAQKTLDGKGATFIAGIAAILPNYAKHVWNQVDGTFADVKRDGSAGTAWLVTMKAGIEWREQVDIQEIDGSWKLVLDQLGMLGRGALEIGGPSQLPDVIYTGASAPDIPEKHIAKLRGTNLKFLGSPDKGPKIIEWYKTEFAKGDWVSAKRSSFVSRDGSSQWMWQNGQRPALGSSPQSISRDPGAFNSRCKIREAISVAISELLA